LQHSGRQGAEGAGRIAKRKGVTPAQLALARLLDQIAQKPWIVPVPSTRRLERLNESPGGATVELTTDDLAEIEAPSEGRNSGSAVSGTP